MKNKKIKNVNYQSEDLKEIKTLIIITVIIVVIAVGLYFLTEMALNKKKTSGAAEAVISYRETTIGAAFSRPYEEYYVFAYSSNDTNASQYDTLFDNYESKEDSKKIYFVDLSLKFNSHVLSDTSNSKPTGVSDLKIKDAALILIKDGKVSKYYETTSEFEKALN